MKKIKWFFLETIISILQLIAIVFVSNLVSPYLFTSEQYGGKSENVSQQFPIAIYSENKPHIIRWDEYIESPEKYNQQLITSEIQHFKIDDWLYFKFIKKSLNVYNVEYHTDNYMFWSSYTIKNGKLYPLSYRINGPFVAFPLIIILVIITSIINKIIKKRYFNNNQLV